MNRIRILVLLKSKYMKKTIYVLLSCCLVISTFLVGCSDSTSYSTQLFSGFRINSAKTLPYDVETHLKNGDLSSAIRVKGISYKQNENYLTKNKDVEITIKYEVLYKNKNFLPDELFSISIKDKNGNYPLIEDGRMYSKSDGKVPAKDIYLDFTVREAHYSDSITFNIKDIENGDYLLFVDSVE